MKGLAPFLFILAISASVLSDEKTDLAKGKTFLKLEPVAGTKIKQGTIKGVIDLAAEEVWTILIDFGHYKEFMPKVVESEIREQAPNQVRYFSKLNMPWPIVDVSYEANAELSSDHRELTVLMVPGTEKGVKSFKGVWKLQDFEGDSKKTLATYTLLFEPDRWYPSWAINMGTEHTLGKMIEALRKRALVKK